MRLTPSDPGILLDKAQRISAILEHSGLNPKQKRRVLRKAIAHFEPLGDVTIARDEALGVMHKIAEEVAGRSIPPSTESPPPFEGVTVRTDGRRLSPISLDVPQEVAATIDQYFSDQPATERERIAAGIQDIMAGRKETFEKDGFKFKASPITPKDHASLELNRLIHAETYTLGRVNESALHKIREKFRDGSLLFPSRTNDAPMPADMRQWTWAGYQVFLIQHDWSAAFSKATDYEGGEVRLPADLCVFEARVNGMRIAMDMMAHGGTILYVETSAGWAAAGLYEWDGHEMKRGETGKSSTPRNSLRLANFLGGQIRAVCIALDSEVAETTVVRAPHKLNRAREKVGKLPLFDHHVVDLSRRRRLVPAADGVAGEGTKRRMHFVRGHWRHYANGKTWIKWHLRGSPDLGFIDKEYRL